MTRQSDDLDRYLSGELPMDELPERYRTEEARLRELMGTLREDAAAPEGFRDSVMRAVAAVPASPARRALGWLGWWMRPREVRIRPAAAVLLAAAAAAILLLWPGRPPTQVASPSADDGQVVTRFVLVAPEASSVRLTGDFVSWNREGIALQDLRGTGVWTADVKLPPGIYQYTFVIDGTDFVPDPRAVSQVDDGFGQVNSVVIVPGEGAA